MISHNTPNSLTHFQDAAKRLIKYWELRREICESDETTFLPMTLNGVLRDDSVALSMGLCQILPYKDPSSGRRILFMDSSRQDYSIISVKSQARATAYMLTAALEDETTQQKGIIVIFWPARERWDQHNREFISLAVSSLKGALPGKYARCCCCCVSCNYILLYRIFTTNY